MGAFKKKRGQKKNPNGSFLLIFEKINFGGGAWQTPQRDPLVKPKNRWEEIFYI